MTTVTFDTLEFVRRLRQAGFDDTQSEAVVRVLADSQSQLVTREYFDLKLDKVMEHVDLKLEKTNWMLGVLVALNAAVLVKQFF